MDMGNGIPTRSHRYIIVIFAWVAFKYLSLYNFSHDETCYSGNHIEEDNRLYTSTEIRGIISTEPMRFNITITVAEE